jgi:hypothetical protein
VKPAPFGAVEEIYLTASGGLGRRGLGPRLVLPDLPVERGRFDKIVKKKRKKGVDPLYFRTIKIL